MLADWLGGAGADCFTANVASFPPALGVNDSGKADWAKYLDAAMELGRRIGPILQQLEIDGLAQDTIRKKTECAWASK